MFQQDLLNVIQKLDLEWHEFRVETDNEHTKRYRADYSDGKITRTIQYLDNGIGIIVSVRELDLWNVFQYKPFEIDSIRERIELSLKNQMEKGLTLEDARKPEHVELLKPLINPTAVKEVFHRVEGDAIEKPEYNITATIPLPSKELVDIVNKAAVETITESKVAPKQVAKNNSKSNKSKRR